MKYNIVALRVGLALSVIWVIGVFVYFTSVIKELEGPVLFSFYRFCQLWDTEMQCDANVYALHDLTLAGAFYFKLAAAIGSLIFFWIIGLLAALIIQLFSNGARSPP